MPAPTESTAGHDPGLTSGLFGGCHHWLRPNVICHGGQNLAHVKSRVVAFRLCSIKRLLYVENLPNHPLACHILQQAGRLSYGVEVFLTHLRYVDTSVLPIFYQSLLNAWKGLSMIRKEDAYSPGMFDVEPLFYNPLFPDIFRSRELCQRFNDAGTNKVWHLRPNSGVGWKTAEEISTTTGRLG